MLWIKLLRAPPNHDTLLYGVEVKFYSSRLELTGELETKLPNMFAIGDGAGITRGLAQAGASGVRRQEPLPSGNRKRNKI